MSMDSFGFPDEEKKKRRTGDALEDLIGANLKAWGAQGVVLVKTRPGITFQTRGPRGLVQGRTAGKGDLDFTGRWLATFPAWPVRFDAKSTMRPAFPLSIVKKHQISMMASAWEAGEIAGLLIEFSALPGGPEYYLAPSTVIAPAWKAWRKGQDYGPDAPASIPLATIRATCPRVERHGGALAIVPALEALRKEQEARKR